MAKVQIHEGNVCHCSYFLLSCLLSPGVWVLDESELQCFEVVLSVLQTAVLLYENVTLFFPSFHTPLLSPSLLVFMFSPNCYFSLRYIALWYCFTLVSFLFCFSISELSSENVRTCFQIINAYIYLSATDFLQVGIKTTSNKRKFKENGNDCERHLICTFSKDECGTNLKTCVCVCVMFQFEILCIISDFYRIIPVCRTV